MLKYQIWGSRQKSICCCILPIRNCYLDCGNSLTVFPATVVLMPSKFLPPFITAIKTVFAFTIVNVIAVPFSVLPHIQNAFENLT
jgi:hypothetical protein